MKRKIKVDCYGFTQEQEGRFLLQEGHAIDIDKSTEGTTYTRYGLGAKSAIHRSVTSDGVTSTRWAYGAWADRATLDYSAGLDETIWATIDDGYEPPAPEPDESDSWSASASASASASESDSEASESSSSSSSSGIPQDAVFYAPLNSAAANAETGQTLISNGTVGYSLVGNVPCLHLQGNGSIGVQTLTGIPAGDSPRTITYWTRPSASSSGEHTEVFIGAQEYHGCVGIGTKNDGGNVYPYVGIWYGDAQGESPISTDVWHFVSATYDGSTLSVYVDGVLAMSLESELSTVVDYFYIGRGMEYGGYTPHYYGDLAALRVYNRVLSAEEIAALANEFSPSYGG